MSLFGLRKRSKAPVTTTTITGAAATPVMRELPHSGGAGYAMSMRPTPAEIRVMLFDAMARRDEAAVARLCRDHREVVRAHIASWFTAPEVLQGNRAAADWCARGVRMLKSYCASSAATAAA